jgi:GNAT superfamily N-acetyltransferase
MTNGENSLATEAQLKALFNHPRPELLDLANRHTMAVQAWLSSRSPQGARFEGEGVIATSSGYQVPLLNLALSSHYPDAVARAVIDEDIAAVKRFFASRQVPWSWWTSCVSKPPTLGLHLAEYGGFEPPHALPAMIAPLPIRVEQPVVDQAVQVWKAETIADLKAASLIRRKAFRFPEGAALNYFEAMAGDWLDQPDRVRLYLARRGDQPPASLGALIMGAGLPGVYVMATLPGYQRQGLGKAILSRILAEATAEGYAVIVLTASRLGFLLYSQFGFVHLFDYMIYTAQLNTNS